MDPVTLGRRLAWLIFVCATSLHLLAFALTRQGRACIRESVFAVDLGILALAPLVALIIELILPPEGRRSFWTTGTLCIFLTAALWGVTCGPYVES